MIRIILLSLGVASAALAEAPGPASRLFVAGNRECATVATGCALSGPHGAFATEKALVQRLADGAVWGGTSFQCRERQESADALAKEMKRFGALSVVALGRGDVTLPKKKLARLAKLSGKAFVATNVSGAWKTSAVFSAGGQKFRVFSVFGPEFRQRKALRWTDAVTTLPPLLAEGEGAITNVVFVSTADLEWMTKIANLPHADVVVDAQGSLLDWPEPEKLVASGNWLTSLPERARWGHAFRFDGKGNVLAAERTEIAD